MAAKLLEGKPVAETIRSSIQAEVSALKTKHSKAPMLVAIQAGESAASVVYSKSQKKLAESLGIGYELKVLGKDVTQDELESLINSLNIKRDVTAIILQLPVPEGIDSKKLSGLISADKDAEGMHPRNLGRIVSGNYTIGPCTAMAVMEILGSTGVQLYGKEACIVGHSEIVGKPLALMLLKKFATTTVCHIATGERGFLGGHIMRAELVVVAVGKPGIIKGDWIKEGAIVIDVGINRVGDKIVGDVEFEKASERADFITPVPGGVGPLTTTILMRNVTELFKAGLKENLSK